MLYVDGVQTSAGWHTEMEKTPQTSGAEYCFSARASAHLPLGST